MIKFIKGLQNIYPWKNNRCRFIKNIFYILLISSSVFAPFSSSLSSDDNSQNIVTESPKSFEGEEISRIEFYGNKIVSLAKINQIVTIKPGDLFNSENLKQNIKKLYEKFLISDKIDAFTAIH